VWIPSDHEWFKAAAYDPTKNGGTGGYWARSTQSDTLAGNTIGVANSANYYDGDLVGYPSAALTEVGAYGANSESYYGTNDQSGNVREWNDAVISSSRGLRGGSWAWDSNYQSPSSTFSATPADEQSDMGFRVASAIPEPATGLLAALGLFPLLSRRRK
jgi:formylglycine-generating enzyme required for sulfatase activity